MPRHAVWFTVPERRLGNADIEFAVYADGERLGLLKVSKGSVVWRHANKKLSHSMDWSSFDRIMQAYGRRERPRPG